MANIGNNNALRRGHPAASKSDAGKRAATAPVFVPSETEIASFNAAVDYLNRRWKKMEVGKKIRNEKANGDGTLTLTLYENRRAKIKKKFSPIRQALSNLVKSGSVGANFSALGANAVSKATLTTVKGARVMTTAAAVTATAESLAAANLLSSGVNAAVTFQNMDAYNSKKKNAILQAMKYQGLALKHMQNPTPATADAYRKFTTAMAGFAVSSAEKSPTSNPFKVVQNMIAGMSEMARAKIVLNAAAARESVNVTSGVLGTVTPVLSAAGPAGPALTAVTGPLDILSGAVTHVEGKLKEKASKRKRDQVSGWFTSRPEVIVFGRDTAVSNAHEEAGKEPGNHAAVLPREAMRDAANAEFTRQRRIGRWTMRAGISQIVKGSVNLTTGIVATTLLSLAVVAGVASAVFTAGIAVLVVGSVAGAAYAGAVVAKAMHRRMVNRHDKRRQRQAQAIIAIHSPQALKALLEDRTSPSISVPTRERRHWQFFGKRQVRYRPANPRINGYVALHVMAHEVASAMSVTKNSQQVAWSKAEGVEEVTAFLQAMGMSAFEVQAIYQAAEALPPAARLIYLKKAMAPSLGLNFRTESDGEEKPLIREVCLREFSKLCSFGNEMTSGQALTVSKKLFGQVDYYRFEQAVGEASAEREANGESSEVEASRFLKWESNRRRNELLDLAAVDPAAKANAGYRSSIGMSKLMSLLGQDQGESEPVSRIAGLVASPESIINFLGFARLHAYHLQYRGEALDHIRKWSPPTDFIAAWRDAERREVLPDESWVSTVRDIVRQLP